MRSTIEITSDPVQKTAPESAETSNSDCHHHWLIERANGLMSVAVCKYCKEKREFWNILPQ